MQAIYMMNSVYGLPDEFGIRITNSLDENTYEELE